MASDLAMLWDLLESPVEALGYELVHIEFSSPSKSRILRLYIDAPGGIRVEDCESVSRQVSAILDVEVSPVPKLRYSPQALSSVLPSGYVLEVSSPGLDRPLVKPQHFQRFTGHRAQIVLNADASAHYGASRFIGKLLAADAQHVQIEVASEQYQLAYDEIASARLKPVF